MQLVNVKKGIQSSFIKFTPASYTRELEQKNLKSLCTQTLGMCLVI